MQPHSQSQSLADRDPGQAQRCRHTLLRSVVPDVSGDVELLDSGDGRRISATDNSLDTRYSMRELRPAVKRRENQNGVEASTALDSGGWCVLGIVPQELAGVGALSQAAQDSSGRCSRLVLCVAIEVGQVRRRECEALISRCARALSQVKVSARFLVQAILVAHSDARVIWHHEADRADPAHLGI